jgi:cystathionine gamma-synthase/cystathionine gamma-lyase/cystathionine beta-lyase
MDGMARQEMATRVVHAGEHPRIGGAIVTPVFQTAMYEAASDASYHDIRYIRLNNTPNHAVLHAKLADLEGGEAALVAASGMAAIAATLSTLLGGGGHLLAQRCLYGGTFDFLTQDAADFGFSHTFIDAQRPDTWAAALRPSTRAIYVEALTNPTLEVADLAAVVAFARAHGLVAVIDSTFASPVNFRPLSLGFDLVVHSCTKYLNGHSDLVAGALAGRGELVERVRVRLNHLGGALDPHACFLLQRGMKTLAVRVAHQNATAMAVAEALAAMPGVTRVLYPGLPAHPQHARARELFDGFGGMLAFEVAGGAAAADRLLDRLQVIVHAVSLGGVETLATRPARTAHAGMTAAERAAAGIGDGLIRLSVGLEATRDLVDDLRQALA